MVGSPTYDGLFEMLLKKRFDYFPRAVNEPWAEVRVHKDKNLVVEETILIKYIAPIYFFVSPDDIWLANRLEKRLRRAIKDGSFEELFRNHPANKEVFEFANIEKRKIIRLNNPLLTQETPIGEKEFWHIL